MSSLISIDHPQPTAEYLCQHVSTSPLLPQLLREIIIDEILVQWQSSPSTILANNALELPPSEDQIRSPQLSEIDRDAIKSRLSPIEDRDTKLQQFKQDIWGGKIGSYYLSRKAQLDRVICSIFQTADGTIAQELFFRVCSDPKIFSKIALQYSQGAEAFDGGKLGPVVISKLHPAISTQLLLLHPGQISPLFTVDNFYIFLRLERVVPAQFDDDLRQLLLNELFEQWLQARIIDEIGLVSVQSELN